MKRFLLILTVLPALLMGCAKDGAEGRHNSDGVLTFSPITYADEITEYDWVAGEIVGMYMVPAGMTVDNAATVAAIYKYDAGKLVWNSPADKLVLPNETSKIFVSYKLKGVTPTNYTFTVDTRNQVDYKTIDLLYSNDRVIYNTLLNNTDVEITYKHMMSKLIFRFTSTDATKLQNLTNIKLSGAPTSVTFSMINEKYSALTGDGLTTAVTSVVPTNPVELDTKVYEVIVPPQPSGWTNRELSYEISGVATILKIKGSDRYNKGKKYIYEVDIDAIEGRDVVLEDPKVIPWGEKQGNLTKEVTNFFTDPVFRAWVQKKFCGGRTEIYQEDLENVTEIEIRKSELIAPKTIKTLAGLEFFPKLEKLDVSNFTEGKVPQDLGFGIEHINVSANPLLTDLLCNYNQLPSLDVSNLTALTNLDCASNQLTRLDVSKNTALTSLRCNYNQLPSLNVSGAVALKVLWCAGNPLTSLDVSGATALTNLYCQFNQLTSLDVSTNKALTWLECYNNNNQLTSLDISTNTNLTNLSCGSNPLTSLDVSKNTALTTLSCHSNLLTSLDVSNNTALTNLYCYYNRLTSLDVRSSTALTDLICYSNLLTSLDVSLNTALTTLSCYSNQLTSLDVRSSTALTDLICYSNLLTSLDLSSHSDITKISSINFSANPGNGTTSGTPNPADFVVKLPAGTIVGNLPTTVWPTSGYEFLWTYQFSGGVWFDVKTKYTVAVAP